MGHCECEGEVPCWSGVWFEIEGHGYMEISDADELYHRPPGGWTLERVDVNPLRSSQIFRYIPVPSRVGAVVLDHKTPGVLAMVGACGTAIVGLPFIQAIMQSFGGVA